MVDQRFASRLIAARGDIADQALMGKVEADWFVEPEIQAVTVPVLDLFAKPDDTEIASQLLLGEAFGVLERDARTGLAWGQAVRDGYVGYVDEKGLGQGIDGALQVSARATHIYPEPNFKTRPVMSLPFGAWLPAMPAEGTFRKTPLGYVPDQHIDQRLGDDFVSVAERFVGAPYLWGGRSAFGLDCSGLIQTALHAVGMDCPRDSDMQEVMLGHEIGAGEPLKRGDLVFWKRHVGIMIDAETLLHANAGAMAVAHENLAATEARILAAGDGPFTARKRIGD